MAETQKLIAVFDSGLGGLTALRELMKVLPGEELIYFGDTARIPYGTRSKQTVLKYTRQDIRFLMGFDPKLIVCACGTASSFGLPQLSPGEFGVPLFGVVDTAAKQACQLSKNRRVAVLATPGTIASGSFEQAMKQIDPTIETLGVPAPLLVHMVEAGRYHTGDIVIETLVNEYLEPVRAFAPDVLILGCTHYPLLREVIAKLLPGVTLLDVGAQAANTVKAYLQANDLLRTVPADTPSPRFFVSDSTVGFTALATIFLAQNLGEDQVEKIDIERY